LAEKLLAGGGMGQAFDIKAGGVHPLGRGKKISKEARK